MVSTHFKGEWRLAGPALCLVAGLVCGCASPGVPKPPSLRLPEKAAKLQAERVGAEVRLSWTTPANTSDGDAIRDGISAAICRRQRSGACVPLRQMAVTPGASAAIDTLPGPLRVGADSLLEYHVELNNERGRSAGPSEPAFAAGGRAPETPAGLAAMPRRDGVLLTWQPEASGAPGAIVQLERSLPDAGPAPAKSGRRNAAATPFTGTAKADDGKVFLVAEGGDDAHGMLDRSAKSGQTYTYVAERVRRTQVAGHALELRSAAAAPVTITYANTFPPAAPTGLATVPGGGFGTAPSVDLSWEPNSETDLAGYRVYRAVDGGAATLVTPAPVAGAAYRDLQVVRGHTYSYAVSAVDARGNESERSAEAREVLR